MLKAALELRLPRIRVEVEVQPETGDERGCMLASGGTGLADAELALRGGHSQGYVVVCARASPPPRSARHDTSLSVRLLANLIIFPPTENVVLGPRSKRRIKR